MHKRVLTLATLLAGAVAFLGFSAPGEAGAGAPGIYLELTNGSRLKTPDSTAVYFVDDGVLRHIHYEAYVAMWSGWSGIAHVNQVPESAIGEPVRGSSRLVRVPGERAVWFIDNDRVRRWVPTFAYAQFSWSKVQEISDEELQRYELGPDLD